MAIPRRHLPPESEKFPSITSDDETAHSLTVLLAPFVSFLQMHDGVCELDPDCPRGPLSSWN